MTARSTSIWSKSGAATEEFHFIRHTAMAFAALMALLVALRLTPIPASILADPGKRAIIDLLPPDEIADLKFRHAAAAARYDIGLFGNSRILMVGTQELGLAERTLFNFAIPGQSMRQSIDMLEALYRIKKAPRIAIISMDYVELGLPGGAGVYPGVPSRWWRASADVADTVALKGVRAGAVAGINAAGTEAAQAAVTFNHTYLASKLEAVFGLRIPHGTTYRGDGSRYQPNQQEKELGMLPIRADTYPLLERDFTRLAVVASSGTRVIVYESPVAPSLMTVREGSLSANARDVRRRYHAACLRFHIECADPPKLTSYSWFDRDHAPAPALAAWLRERFIREP